MLLPDHTNEDPVRLRLGLDRLIELHRAYSDRLIALTTEAVVNERGDLVSIHVNAVKLKELGAMIKTGLDEIKAINEHP